jgi:ABC-type transport system involved in multi-copper enzyme maturation permease subunit
MTIRPGSLALVATHVFKESVRDKVLYNLVAFAVLMIAVSYLIGQLTAGQDVKIVKDLGLAAMSVFGLFIAIFIGVGLVAKELERRSVYGLLVKPLERHEFILGKYAGLMLTLTINIAIMTVAYYAVLWGVARTTPEQIRQMWAVPALDPGLMKAVLLIVAQFGLVTAIALFFSTFSSPFLSAALTFGLYVAGHFGADLREFGSITESPIGSWLCTALSYILPNFAVLDVKAAVVHGRPVPWTYVGGGVAYVAIYASALLTAAVLIFSRRDFK